jgi:hypothetical protein
VIDKVMTTYKKMEPSGPVVSNGEGEGRPLADVIYIYVDRDHPGIKLNVYSKSNTYYDKFTVGTYVEEVSYPDEEPITGVITKERIYPDGSRDARTFIVSLEEMKEILMVLKKASDLNKTDVVLDLVSILKKEKDENDILKNIDIKKSSKGMYKEPKIIEGDLSNNEEFDIYKPKYPSQLNGINGLDGSIYNGENKYGGDDSNNTFGF